MTDSKPSSQLPMYDAALFMDEIASLNEKMSKLETDVSMLAEICKIQDTSITRLRKILERANARPESYIADL